MAQEMCVLPMRCKRCNAVFDLWYDLQEQEKLTGETAIEDSGMKKLITQSFCWRCRGVVVDEMLTVNADSSTESEDEYDFSLEF